MGGLQPIHWVIVLVIVVLLFGGSKIPELMRGVGKGMGEFKKGIEEGKKPVDEEDEATVLRERQKALEAQRQQLEEQEAELKRLQEKKLKS